MTLYFCSYVLNTWGNKLLLQWWPWFFYRLGREMVTYLVHLGSTTGFPMELTHCRTIMGWSSVHGKRRENIKKASGVKGFLVRFFYRQSFCWKTLISLLPGWSKIQWQGSSSWVPINLLICRSPTPLWIGLPHKIVLKRNEILFCNNDKIVAQSK